MFFHRQFVNWPGDQPHHGIAGAGADAAGVDLVSWEDRDSRACSALMAQTVWSLCTQFSSIFGEFQIETENKEKIMKKIKIRGKGSFSTR